ncbi:hypothetical protein Trydic_g3712 [Trypoxylus dichotomus]
MWFGLAFRALRTYAPYITLPFAAAVGFLGYKIESTISNKHTPYKEPIKEARNERLISDESLQSAADVEKLRYNANVLGKNLSPSLQ